MIICPTCKMPYAESDQLGCPKCLGKSGVKRVSVNRLAGLYFGLLGAGVGCLFPFFKFPLDAACIGAGITLIVLAVTISARYICGMCGNRVERTSRICPTCKGGL